MKIIKQLLQWARVQGYAAEYGSPEYIDERLTDIDVSASADGTIVYIYLITDSETADGRDRANVGIYFARLMDWEDGGDDVLTTIEELRTSGKKLLSDIHRGNSLIYSGVRWQYGYNEFADNLAYCCLRVTLEASAADCQPLELPGVNE